MAFADRRLTIALFLVVLLGDVSAPAQPTPLRGTLREKGQPIMDAAVFLQSFDDEHCAKIFASQKPSRRLQKKLDRCMHDVSTAVPDSGGYYEFAGLKPGSLRTSGTLMYRTSLALSRQSSYLQQAPLLNDARGKQRELIGYSALHDDAAVFLLRRKVP